ncbi:putative 5`-nucleotidase protein, partial [Diplocarpon rosae]
MVVTSFPFANAVVAFEIRGEEIWTMLEGAFAMVNQDTGKPVTSGIQVSENIQITFNHAAAPARKLISVRIGDEELVRSKIYHIVTLDFLAH